MPGVAITALTDGSDAVATGSVGGVAISRATGFNGSTYDRIRTLGATSLNGLGQATVSLGIPGAGAVLSDYGAIYSSTTRATMTAPTSGKRIRITAVHAALDGASQTTFEIYFGTGTNLAADATKVIMVSSGRADVGFSGSGIGALDGGGKVGAVDEVVSIRQTGANSTSTHITIWYREE